MINYESTCNSCPDKRCDSCPLFILLEIEKECIEIKENLVDPLVPLMSETNNTTKKTIDIIGGLNARLQQCGVSIFFN